MKKALAKTLFTSFAMLAVAGNAEETLQDEASVIEEHVIVDSRPLPQEKKDQLEQQRIAESQQAEELSSQEELELSSLRIPILPQNCIALASSTGGHTAANLSPSMYHWIDFFPQDNIVKTQDGSEWIFDSSDSSVTRTWRSGDTIVITPKGRWFWGSNYSYVMTNKDLGDSLDVNLFLGPIAFGSYSTWIVGVDPNLGQIYMLNGAGERSVWEISNVDLYLFKEWEINDTLLVGQNDSWLWWFSSYNHILVNVNMNHHVRARQISSNSNYRNNYAA
ncbi:MAG: hypothetical protein P0S96_04035 [Simkaniaceae bacterium]|nr:hypothetical protein [Candidatus Sacchlamyda saccharinae]